MSKFHAYIERQRSPLVTRDLDPHFNAVGISDGAGNLVELQLNTVHGNWAVVVKTAGRLDDTVFTGTFPT